MTLVIWWVNVILERQILSFAIFLSSFPRPSVPPIIKDIGDVPLSKWCFIYSEKSSLEYSLPWRSTKITYSPGFIFFKIWFASSFSIASIEPFWIFDSGVSIISTFANLDNLFKYSSISSRWYFSFIFPTPYCASWYSLL